MKKQFITLAITAALFTAPVFANPQQLDPTMPGMAGMHEATPADVQGVGVVKAIDTAKGAITLQHEAIAAIGWPAMTIPIKVARSEEHPSQLQSLMRISYAVFCLQ